MNPVVRREDRAQVAGAAGGPSVLVVEDDVELNGVLVSSLVLAGFSVRSAGTGAEALAAEAADPVDLVLLDVGLPDQSGFEVGRTLRDERRRVPIIYLTARDELGDKLTAFESGADDYLTKPFSFAELVARIRAVLARSTAPADPLLRYADLTIDIGRHIVTRAGVEVELTATEFRLLQFLVVNAEQVVSRQEILHQVWGYDFEGNASVVENYISFLRRKLDDRAGQLIRTVRGVGYTVRRSVP